MTARLGRTAGLALAIAAVAALIGLGASITDTGRNRAAAADSPGPEGVPLVEGLTLGPPRARPADGIPCASGEALSYHVHAHLAVFVDGQPRAVPLGIGIGAPLRIANTAAGPFAAGGECFSFLHTHAADGIVHVEAPGPGRFSLGQFFDVWGQPLSAHRVGPARGTVSAFVGGRPFHGDPRAIALAPHAQIQLDAGQPVIPPRPVRFPAGL